MVLGLLTSLILSTQLLAHLETYQPSPNGLPCRPFWPCPAEIQREENKTTEPEETFKAPPVPQNPGSRIDDQSPVYDPDRDLTNNTQLPAICD